ncbi:mariner Mos1 transposase [Trichonephila clavipes]|nr:mariner Mos1 transposase [Trichonephila clavipes]
MCRHLQNVNKPEKRVELRNSFFADSSCALKIWSLLVTSQFHLATREIFNSLYRFIVEKRGRPSKKCEDAELQALLDEDDDGQTQKHLAEQLNVDQSTASHSLKAMGKIIKVGRWAPNELTDRQQENQKNRGAKCCCPLQTQSHISHCIVTGNEKWIYFENPNHNRSYVDQDNRPKSTQGLIALAARQCSVFSGIRRDQHIMSFLKPSKTVNTDCYKQQLHNLNDAIL